MITYTVSAFLHLVTGVLLAGYALFWVVMARGLRRERVAAESMRLMDVINRGRWPPGGLPKSLRLPVPVLAWLLLAALTVTGVLLLSARGTTLDLLMPGDPIAGRFARVLAWKVALFTILVAGHVVATVRPRAWIAYVNGGLTLAVVIVSALLRH